MTNDKVVGCGASRIGLLDGLASNCGPPLSLQADARSSHHITTQQPHPPFCGFSSSCALSGALTSGDIGLPCIIGPLGLCKGLSGGFSCIFGMVEYDLFGCATGNVGRPISGVSGQSAGFSFSTGCIGSGSSSGSGSGSCSGGSGRPPSVNGLKSLSKTLLLVFPSLSHFSCCNRLATVGSSCWSGGRRGSGR
jgi:hypothetical protein